MIERSIQPIEETTWITEITEIMDIMEITSNNPRTRRRRDSSIALSM
jgi:hypothetical protein